MIIVSFFIVADFHADKILQSEMYHIHPSLTASFKLEY